MDPTTNDVLSGRGAWFNQHSGNKHFRSMLEEKKDAYMAGTKKQKMDISKAIVEAVYSMDPPGRFLKKCSETGQWNELSRRDAADRAAQSMAYVIKGESLKEKRRRRRLGLPPPSLSQNEDGMSIKSLQSTDRLTHLEQHAEGNHHSSFVAHHGLAIGRGGAAGTWNNVQGAREPLHKPVNSNLQQQLLLQQLQLQQSRSSTTNTTTLAASAGNSIYQNVDQNGFAQPRQLLQTPQQQQQQLLLQLQYNLGQNNSLGLGHLPQPQSALQPPLNAGMTHHLLNQAQQQHHHHQQQQLLLHPILHQQNAHPPSSLPMPVSTSAPFLTGHPANNNFVQNVQQQSNAHSFGGALRNDNNMTCYYLPNSNGGISDAPRRAQQIDQLHSSLMLQQNQPLASTSGGSSSNQLPFLQQQVQPALQADPTHRSLQALPSTNHPGMTTSTNAAGAQSTWQPENNDVVQSGPDEDRVGW